MEKPIKFFLKNNRISYHAKYKKILIKKKKKQKKKLESNMETIVNGKLYFKVQRLIFVKTFGNQAIYRKLKEVMNQYGNY